MDIYSITRIADLLSYVYDSSLSNVLFPHKLHATGVQQQMCRYHGL